MDVSHKTEMFILKLVYLTILYLGRGGVGGVCVCLYATIFVYSFTYLSRSPLDPYPWFVWPKFILVYQTPILTIVRGGEVRGGGSQQVGRPWVVGIPIRPTGVGVLCAKHGDFLLFGGYPWDKWPKWVFQKYHFHTLSDFAHYDRQAWYLAGTGGPVAEKIWSI